MGRWKPAAERFAANITVAASGCWEWQGSKSDTGYGCFYAGRAWYAHRYSWMQANGSIPPGLLVLHTCDNRACVNPEHLFLGTHRENSADMVRKGRNHTPPTAGEQHGEAKLTDDAVREIRRSSLTGRALAAQFGVSESAISLVRRGKAWTHIR